MMLVNLEPPIMTVIVVHFTHTTLNSTKKIGYQRMLQGSNVAFAPRVLRGRTPLVSIFVLTAATDRLDAMHVPKGSHARKIEIDIKISILVTRDSSAKEFQTREKN